MTRFDVVVAIIAAGCVVGCVEESDLELADVQIKVNDPMFSGTVTLKTDGQMIVASPKLDVTGDIYTWSHVVDHGVLLEVWVDNAHTNSCTTLPGDVVQFTIEPLYDIQAGCNCEGFTGTCW